MKPIVTQIILLVALIAGTINTAQAQTAEQLYQKGLVKEEGEGALQEAIDLYSQVADNSSASISLRAKALLHVGMCYEKLGTQGAVKAYKRLVSSFPSQKNEVAIARERLSQLILLTENIPEIPVKPNFTKIKIPASPGNGMLSPDGKRLAFVLDGCVWTAPVSGGVDPTIAGEPQRLTGDIGAWDMSNSFCWSGDGKWIAFNARLEPDANEASIYVIPSEGGNVRKVQVPSHDCGWPAEFRLSLSPDGKTLAYATGFIPGDFQTKNTQIYTIPVNGSKVKELTEPGTQEPAFSPDGSKIAYVKCYKGIDATYYYSDVWVIPSEGGTPVQVSNLGPGVVFGPSWSPDGNMIAFMKRPEGGIPQELWIVPVTNKGHPSGTPRKIDLPKPSYHTIAGWTPDNRISIQLWNPEYEIIYTVPATGGIATQVTPQGWTSYPEYSPDGKRIYFRWDGGKIASVPSEGGAVDSVKIDSEFNIITAVPGSGNEISPDGKTIVFSGMKNFYKDGEKRWEVDIFTIPVEGGKPKQLTEISSELQDRFPCWSPDGSSIAFIRPEIVDKESIMHIYTMSGEGENLKKITVISNDVAYAPIDWTPDGKSITFFTNNNSIHSVPFEGGESKLITEIYSVNSQRELAWSPDGKELAYTDQGKIWIYTPGSGTTQEVKTGVSALATKIGWSPDGKKIAFTAFAGGDTELWLMENFLPLEWLTEKNYEKRE
jgi:Tol biopolymer transport system component